MEFLKKLKKQGKIKIVEVSENITESYLQKSKNGISAGEVLIKTKHLEEATSMIYYSMYYSVLALFFKVGIKCENHTGCIMILKKIFNENELAKKLEYAKEERIDKQYYTDYKISMQEVEEFIESAQDFNILIKQKMIINEKKINEIRNKIKLLDIY
jgi:uncharacterized protein (UPF0332 family)